MLIYQKKGEKKLYAPFVLVITLLFIGVFAYVVFAVEEITTVTLNSTSGNNLSSENLTAYPSPYNASQKYIYDWKLDGSSIAVLNMHFEGGKKWIRG